MKHTEETKRKISLANTGYKHTEEAKKKMSLAKKGFHPKTEFKKGYHSSLSTEFKKGHKLIRKRGYKLSEETKKRMSRARTGEKNWRWIKDRSFINKFKRNSTEYSRFVKKVKNRDNWKCKISNKDCFGSCIVHHILPVRNYPELVYEVNNAITLCQSHHPLKWAEEKKMIPIFKELIK